MISRCRRPEQSEREGELLAQDRDRTLDAGGATGGQCPIDRPADEHALGAERAGDGDVEAAADPAIDPHLGPPADRTDDLGQDVDGRRARGRAGVPRGC